MVIVVMGVSGSGKTTVGSRLAQQLGWEFADADDYHSPANVNKMRNGTPLTDADRESWLDALRALVASWMSAGSNAVLACSALREAYRERLRVNHAVRLVYLKASSELLSQRLLERRDHYMKQAMLASQLATLEEPGDALTVNANGTPEQIVRDIRAHLGLA